MLAGVKQLILKNLKLRDKKSFPTLAQFRSLRSLASNAEFEVKVEPEDDQVVPVSNEVSAIVVPDDDRTGADALQTFYLRH